MRSWCLLLLLLVGCRDKAANDSATDTTDADGDGYTVADGDCDDTNATVYPGATEIADGLDNDCDGVVDEYLSLDDNDGDGWSTGAGDCDDTDPTVYPGATEIAGDGIDNNCDGVIDESIDDADGDGYDTDAGDCDDTDATIYPGADDTPYDGIDSNCDGLSDYDADGDGYDSVDYGGDDCNDQDATQYPGADELCDGIDQNCNGLTDEGAVDALTAYYDGDGDGYGETSLSQPLCFLPPDFSLVDGDCDDTDATVYPGATEICGDAIDSNCNGSTTDGGGTDEGCPGQSCYAIYSADSTSPDGLYWIDPVGDGAVQVTCDMADGGWTLVYRGTNAGGVAENGTVDDTGQLGTLPITATSEGSNKLSDAYINALRSGAAVNDLRVSVYVDGTLLGSAWHPSLCELQTGSSLSATDICNFSTTVGPDSTDWDRSDASGTLTRWGADDTLGYIWSDGIVLGPISGGTATGSAPATGCSWSDGDTLCPSATAIEIWAQ